MHWRWLRRRYPPKRLSKSPLSMPVNCSTSRAKRRVGHRPSLSATAKSPKCLHGHQSGPAGATLIDLKDKFVLPGLIDSHVHLDSDAGGNAGLIEAVTDSPARAAYRAAGNAKKTLMAGFTTVRNLGDGSGATLALRDAVAAGELPGPRIIDAGRSISTTSGHMDATLSLSEDLHASDRSGKSLRRRRKLPPAVRKQIRRGVDVIKIATTGGVNSRIGAGLGRQIVR